MAVSTAVHLRHKHQAQVNTCGRSQQLLQDKAHAGHVHPRAGTCSLHAAYTTRLTDEHTCSMGNSLIRSLGRSALGDSVCMVVSTHAFQLTQVARKALRLALLLCRQATTCDWKPIQDSSTGDNRQHKMRLVVPKHKVQQPSQLSSWSNTHAADPARACTDRHDTDNQCWVEHSAPAEAHHQPATPSRSLHHSGGSRLTVRSRRSHSPCHCQTRPSPVLPPYRQLLLLLLPPAPAWSGVRLQLLLAPAVLFLQSAAAPAHPALLIC